MRNFFRTLQEKHNKDLKNEPVETPQYRALAPMYLRFSKQSKLNQSDEAILRDLRLLLQVEGITHVAFRNTPDGIELLLGTTHVYITNLKTGYEHDIGEFIIHINPQNKNASLRFTNITRPLHTRDPENEQVYVFNHPHIYSDGRMCIEMNILNEYITEYKIVSLARILIRALHTVDSVPIPLAKLENWPLRGETP